jgi:hypothetical protein
MIHQSLTLNHRLESWVYANTAARTGATGFVAGDIGRIAYQTDTGQYWRLTATTPTWANVEALTTATLQTGEQTLAGTTSTTGVMLGLGAGGAVITPVRSGKIFATIGGLVSNTVSGGISSAYIKFGTGTAPVNGAAPVGTRLGQALQAHAYAPGVYVPFSLSVLITGLTLGTQIWLDLVQAVVAGGGTINTFAVATAAFELP